MCGRIVQKNEDPELRDFVDPSRIFVNLSPRYNISPSQEVPLIRSNSNNQRELVALSWGLIPHWATAEKNLKPQINARAEGIESKPFFRTAFKKRRCLIPINGFYEWKKIGEKKQAYYIYSTNHRMFFLAGIWDEARELEKQSFAIITTEPNEVISSLHNRMPVIVENQALDQWLLGNLEEAKELLVPWAGDLEAYPVSNFVNSPANDSEECLKRLKE